MLGATRGVTVSTSAFLACHQCYCAGSSLVSGLESSDFSMWHFLKFVTKSFPRVLRFPPPSSDNDSANKIKGKINAISALSKLIAELSLPTMWHVTRDAREKRSMCCT